MLYRDGEGCCKIVVEVLYIVLSLSYCLSKYWLIDWFVYLLLIDLLLCHIEPTTSLKRRPTLLCLYKIWATGLGKYSTLYRVIRICTESIIQPCYTVIIVFSMELEPSSRFRRCRRHYRRHRRCSRHFPIVAIVVGPNDVERIVTKRSRRALIGPKVSLFLSIASWLDRPFERRLNDRSNGMTKSIKGKTKW